jgi:hypothetical protein
MPNAITSWWDQQPEQPEQQEQQQGQQHQRVWQRRPPEQQEQEPGQQRPGPEQEAEEFLSCHKRKERQRTAQQRAVSFSFYNPYR